MRVWLSTLRRGVSWHLIAEYGRSTACGRWIGWDVHIPEDEPQRGHVLPLVRAVDDYAAHQCRRCEGTAVVVEPKILPRRPW